MTFNLFKQSYRVSLSNTLQKLHNTNSEAENTTDNSSLLQIPVLRLGGSGPKTPELCILQLQDSCVRCSACINRRSWTILKCFIFASGEKYSSRHGIVCLRTPSQGNNTNSPTNHKPFTYWSQFSFFLFCFVFPFNWFNISLPSFPWSPTDQELSLFPEKPAREAKKL